MTKKQIKDMALLDELAVKAGGYVAPPKKGQPREDVRALYEYAKKKGVEPINLTENERAMFIIREKVPAYA